MLNNPISQIERTKDAYAGNMQGLQKRANMTKELVDLLAMQQLKQDLDAIKRDQMMQQQGNPATIKDQMQQGLMGEYRQQAAKEMGVGPSEMGTVARAQQGMPQGMPQGAPQQQMPQQPQMAQGVMSQARPVQLAGGGIVAFQEGMRVNAPEKAGFFSQFSLPDMDAVRRAEERRKAERARAIAAGGDYPEDITLDEAVEAINELAEKPLPYTYRARQEAERAAKAKADEGFEFSEEGLAALDEAMRPGKARPKVVPPAGAGTTAGGIAGADGGETPPTLLDRRQQALDQITSMAEIKPYQRDQDLTAMLKKQMARDPSAEGIAAIERIKKLSGLEESRRMLDAQRKRLREDYESTAPSRMDNLIDLFTAGGRGGITGVGVRGSQLREAEAKRRREFTAGLANIDNTAMELQRSVGTSAANNYETAAKTAQGAINSATSTLQQADAAGRSDYVERVKLKMSSKQSLLSHLENLSRDEQAAARAVLDEKRLNADTALGIQKAAELTISQASERIAEARENAESVYAMELRAAVNSGDDTKVETVLTQINEKATADSAADTALMVQANARLQAATNMLIGQGAGMEVEDSEDFTTYAPK